MKTVFSPSTYKYNKETCTSCPIYNTGCRFSALFIKGCKEGRAMSGCNKCKITEAETYKKEDEK